MSHLAVAEEVVGAVALGLLYVGAHAGETAMLPLLREATVAEPCDECVTRPLWDAASQAVRKIPHGRRKQRQWGNLVNLGRLGFQLEVAMRSS